MFKGMSSPNVSEAIDFGEGKCPPEHMRGACAASERIMIAY